MKGNVACTKTDLFYFAFNIFISLLTISSSATFFFFSSSPSLVTHLLQLPVGQVRAHLSFKYNYRRHHFLDVLHLLYLLSISITHTFIQFQFHFTLPEKN